MSNFADSSPQNDATRETSIEPIEPEKETGFTPLSALPTQPRERVSPSKRQDINKQSKTQVKDEVDSSLPSELVLPALDRDLLEPEETEILPLNAAEIDWRKAIDSPQAQKASIAKPSVKKTTLPSPLPSSAPRAASQGSPALLTWRQAGRAQKWTSLSKPNTVFLWILQPLTVLGLGWMLCALTQVGQTLLNGLIFCISWIPFLPSIRFAIDPTWGVVLSLIALFGASPWLLHWLLQWLYQLQPLTLSQLEHYSPESVRLFKRVSHQRRCPVPMLSILPLAAPIAFSYGCLPRMARIAVSQGLLEQLKDDEIAAIYAAELGHIACWDFGVMSGLVLTAQLPYRVYWSIASWGNRQSDRVLQSVAVLVSSLGYGCYWCCRLVGLWLSRRRLSFSDRLATNLTGNPNGLTRALLKITIGMATEIQHQEHTHPLLESFDLLLPVSPRAALTLGSLYPYAPTPAALMSWDRSHPYRHWFACAASHPLLGDRLHRLTTYAHRWRLEPELDWEEPLERRGQKAIHPPKFSRFLLQTAPLVGSLVGLAIGLMLWLLGWITYQAYSYSFDWLWYERESIAKGCMLLGFGIGLLIQINPAFGDIPRSNRQPEPNLIALLSDPTLMPIDSTPVRFQGKLLGRCRFLNRYYQDLILQTPNGLVRLHYASRGGLLGNLCSQSQRPTDLIKPNETVSITGWFRHGATPWIDVDKIQTKRGITIHSGYPVWLTVAAIGSALWGIYILF